MMALLLRAVGELELVDAPHIEPAPDEELVEVIAAGVCGSDYHSARDGGLMRNPPIIMGHEFSGLAGGRRVTVNPLITCGECAACSRGEDNLCANREIIGITRQGAFAEAVAVPSRSIVELPDDVPIEAGALAEPLAVALHGVKLADLELSTHLGVIGAGTIGQLVTRIAWGLTDHVHVVDLDDQRLTLAKRMGAARTSTTLEGEYDVIIDAAGTTGSHRASLEHLRPGGTTVWIGNESPDPGFDAQMLVRSGHRVFGSAAYTHADFEEAVGMVDDAMLGLAVERPLADGVEVMNQLMEQHDAPVKVLLKPETN